MSTLRRRKAATPVEQWPLDTRITVVLFAGLGGACAGLEEAGCPVHVANNHDEVALAAHAALHPHTKHLRGDIFDVDPLQATGRRQGDGLPVDLLNAEEEARIRELIAAGQWPDGWEGTEPNAATPLDQVFRDGSVQPLLIGAPA